TSGNSGIGTLQGGQCDSCGRLLGLFLGPALPASAEAVVDVDVGAETLRVIGTVSRRPVLRQVAVAAGDQFLQPRLRVFRHLFADGVGDAGAELRLHDAAHL